MTDKKTDRKKGSSSKKIEQLENQLKELEVEKNEVFEKLQRISADYANYQKRIPKQIDDNVSYEKEKIIKSLLPALDNFEHTLQHTETTKSVEDFSKGVKIIYDQMIEILKTHHVEQIQAAGEKFDPAIHQAILQQNLPDTEDDIIIEQFQTGYKLNDRVIRPSKVIVNKHEQQNQTDQNDESPDSE